MVENFRQFSDGLFVNVRRMNAFETEASNQRIFTVTAMGNRLN
ncbi:hypothetical protein J18TS1_41510 [Oceanobacillus oncorhynchi subsp. incaldanensis]|nr:hypothetical protein J18TS1_41510 [Oceanobacillus oncorhynchi subsp. incaldanensis]